MTKSVPYIVGLFIGSMSQSFLISYIIYDFKTDWIFEEKPLTYSVLIGLVIFIYMLIKHKKRINEKSKDLL